MNPHDGQARRLGLLANSRGRGWADGRALAGAPATPLPWCHGGEPWHSIVVPGEPCWRWIHFHWLFFTFGWIHLHGLHTISHMSDGRCYHAADGAPPLMLPPLPPRFLQSCLCSPTQGWAATHLAALGPLATKHPWQFRASKLSELWASCRGPVFIGPGTEGGGVAHDIRRPL